MKFGKNLYDKMAQDDRERSKWQFSYIQVFSK